MLCQKSILTTATFIAIFDEPKCVKRFVKQILEVFFKYSNLSAWLGKPAA